MNKTKVVIASALLSGVMFVTSSAQIEFEFDTVKKASKNSFGISTKIFNPTEQENAFSIFYQRKRKNLKLNFGIVVNTNPTDNETSPIIDTNVFYNQKEIKILTIPDSNNIFIGRVSSFSKTTAKLNLGIQREFAQHGVFSMFYIGNIVLGVEKINKTYIDNQYKFVTLENGNIEYAYQYTYEKELQRIRNSYLIGLSNSLGQKLHLGNKISIAGQIELETNIIKPFKNNETTTINNDVNQVTDFSKSISFDLNVRVWFSLIISI